jgi:hypothetical protein
MRGPKAMNRAAVICVLCACPGEGRGASPFCICAKILSRPASPQGLQWAPRLYAIAARPSLDPGPPNRSPSLPDPSKLGRRSGTRSQTYLNTQLPYTNARVYIAS